MKESKGQLSRRERHDAALQQQYAEGVNRGDRRSSDRQFSAGWVLKRMGVQGIEDCPLCYGVVVDSW